MAVRKKAKTKTAKTISVAGLKLRPFGFGDLILVGKMGIDIDAEGGGDNLDEFAQLEQAAKLLWLQSTDPRKARQAVRDGTWEDEVADFADNLDLSKLADYGAAIEASTGG